MAAKLFPKNAGRLSLGLLIISFSLAWPFIFGVPGLMAADDGGMCAGQKPITDKEVVEAFDALAEILKMGDQRSPADEENMIRGRGLSAERLNCVFGKIMAGNDIFGWGEPSAYGVSLSDEEKKIIKKYANESKGLKKYLEEELNITTEKE